MAAFSMDLRQRVLADCQAGITFAEIARKFSVSAEWVRIFFRRFQDTGEIAPRSNHNHRVPFHQRHEPEIRRAVEEKPDRTLEELRQHLGLKVSLSTLATALHALQITFKKK